MEKIKYFFTHYKDLDAGKWVKVGEWVDGEIKSGIVLKKSCVKWVGVNNYLNNLI